MAQSNKHAAIASVIVVTKAMQRIAFTSATSPFHKFNYGIAQADDDTMPMAKAEDETVKLMGADEHKKLERIYSTLPASEIPWVSEELPEEFVELIESGVVKPCKAIDLGCGVGWYAIYLAKLGFDVIGVDISESAIKRAMENARASNVTERCKFIVADVLSDLPSLIGEKFEFAYDWYLLHHIYPEHRERYIANVDALLCSGGKYLSACFSEADAHFGGVGKYRLTPLGTVLYFSSEKELYELFGRRFRVLELRTVKVKSRSPTPHDVIIALMEKP